MVMSWLISLFKEGIVQESAHKNCANFTGKYLRCSLFLIMLQVLPILENFNSFPPINNF